MDWFYNSFFSHLLPEKCGVNWHEAYVKEEVCDCRRELWVWPVLGITLGSVGINWKAHPKASSTITM